MTSLGLEAYVGTLNADIIKYKTLDPALTGFVHNPLNTDLDCDNRNLTNANEITTGTLNYTTLNPPIPTGFVNNPMSVSLDGGNFNITDVNAIESTTVQTTGKLGSDLEIISNGKLEGANGLVSGNWEVGGNLTVDTGGLTSLKGSVVIGSSGETTLQNRLIFKAIPSYDASIYGAPTQAGVILLTPLAPASGITSFTLNPATSSVVVFGRPAITAPTYSTMEITTPYANVLRDYTFDITETTINGQTGNGAIPNLSVNVGQSDKSPADDTKFQFVIEHGNSPPVSNQIVKYHVKLTYTGI